MQRVELLAKKNQDGSFSVSYESGGLIRDCFVDFYDEKGGSGYQRNETLRAKRGREIEEYLRLCVSSALLPRLFEMTANARVQPDSWKYDAIDEGGKLGILAFDIPENNKWLAMIDGGTRLLGIENALAHHIIDETTTFDIRISVGLTLSEEIAQFLLINENQKKVRTDLGLRVVQRQLDEGQLSDDEKRTLQTVVPDTDSWKFEASRIAAQMNGGADSPWHSRIQMPGEVTKPLTLQAFFTSLKPILNDPDIKSLLSQMEKSGNLVVNGATADTTSFLVQVLKNFWKGVALANPDADTEPDTSVLWGSIGASSCHIGLAPIVKTILQSNDRSLTAARFESVLRESEVANYDFWFTKPGTKKERDRYPRDKGEATMMTGAANYGRLGKKLEQEWRAALHSHAAQATANA